MITQDATSHPRVAVSLPEVEDPYTSEAWSGRSGGPAAAAVDTPVTQCSVPSTASPPAGPKGGVGDAAAAGLPSVACRAVGSMLDGDTSSDADADGYSDGDFVSDGGD